MLQAQPSALRMLYRPAASVQSLHRGRRCFHDIQMETAQVLQWVCKVSYPCKVKVGRQSAHALQPLHPGSSGRTERKEPACKAINAAACCIDVWP